MGPNMERYLEALFQVLPASSGEEIRQKMSKYLGQVLTLALVQKVLKYLRRNALEQGWIVPYVDGPSSSRYFVVLVEKDGTFYFDEETRTSFDSGALSKLRMAQRIVTTLSLQFEISGQYERSPVRKTYLRDHAENMRVESRRLARDCGEIEAEQRRLRK